MADIYISNIVKMLHKYCISRKNTKRAERMRPMPRLNITRSRMGRTRRRKYGVKVTPSIMQKRRKTTKVRAKFISEETLREKTNRYFGTFIFVKMAEFDKSEDIPPPEDSLK